MFNAGITGQEQVLDPFQVAGLAVGIGAWNRIARRKDRTVGGAARGRPRGSEAMEERRLKGIRRDATAAAELAAVAAAAMRSMQDQGGTPIERAGVMRITAMARNCAESVIEAVDFAERRMLGSLGGG